MTIDDYSVMQRIRRLPEARRCDAFAGINSAERKTALASWHFAGRTAQRDVSEDWSTWLILAGRGFGKTRSGAEWVKSVAWHHPGARIALVGATLHEVRTVMVEGPAGVLAFPTQRYVYEPSNRRIVFERGASAHLFSADDPDSLRGAEHSHAWGDEIAKWPNGDAAWMNLRMGLRQGKHPRAILTTTPRPTPLVKALIDDAKVRKSLGRTAHNADNLAPDFVEMLTAAYGGTRLGRQELDGELVEDIEGALWSRELFERCRSPMPPRAALARVVVGVDPPADGGTCGIVVAGLRADGSAVIIEDASVSAASPEGWARAVAGAAARWAADRVVAEVNNGGAMVTSMLCATDSTLPVKAVRASQGKSVRAEPVLTLYERGRVRHAGAFPDLEDELCGLITGGGYAGPGRSPDRADALVWALTELLLSPRARPGIRVL